MEQAEQEELEAELTAHEKENPVPEIRRLSDGSLIPEGTPVQQLVIPGGVAELEVHPEAMAELEDQGKKRPSERGLTGAAPA